MKVFDTVQGIKRSIRKLKENGKSIGFVPTMGALHEGHLSLIRDCNQHNDVTVVSIFVNPTQFNQRDDYENYPRDLDGDIDILEQYGTEIVFTPSEGEIYPEVDQREFDFGDLDKVMEGEHRPGHFNGVAQIVSRLFDIIRPHKAYFGEKDFQQLVIIRELTSQLGMNIDIIGCPIKREKDGLAKSSRNARLTEGQRNHASMISQKLFEGKKKAENYTVESLKEWIVQQLNNDPFIDVEYFEIVDEKNLQPVKSWNDTYYKRACIAAWVGPVRLIDNVKYYF
jgi:pantoate--beta-alanine ligase